MKNIFCPNGTDSLSIVHTLAKAEFGEKIGDKSSYFSLKKDILFCLRKMEYKDLEENKLDTIIGIEHLKNNDFGNFISIRFAFWGMILALVVIIIGNNSIASYFNMTSSIFAEIVCIILTVLLITMSRTIHIQHDQLEYLNFKLLCISELVAVKK